jgi:LmbE family N-acetylglucosaminyl deacetylase
MKTMREVVAGKRVGLITAHPDDHLIHVHGVAGAAELHEHIETVGRNAGVNHREADGFSVARGDRRLEALRGAGRMGIGSVSQRNLTDGQLAAEIDRAVLPAARWLTRRRIDVLLTLGGLDDHTDHIATGLIGELAAARVLEKTGCEVRVFDIYADGTGSHTAEATPHGMEQAFLTASKHPSQFRSSPDTIDGWPIVPGGGTMHPDDLAALNQYPLLYDATYRERAVGGLAVPGLTEVTLAGTR